MSKTSEIATRTEEVDLSSPKNIMEFATSLKKLIVENKLFTNIKGKNYINVEGWQIAGAFTGIVPIVEKVECLNAGTVYKYRAEVSLRDNEGHTVGYGVALCSNKEAGKNNFDEFAVASMAQTRAIGKAYRMKIGWLLKIAGYETTPAEEMDTVVVKEVKPEPSYNSQQIALAKLKLGCVKNIEELKEVWDTLGEVTHCQEVIDYKDNMKEQLGDE